MLKLAIDGTKDDDEPWRLVILGLSYVNLDRLKDGRPIKFDGTAVGLPQGTEILIFAGETEQSMAREIAEFIGPDTKVHIDPRFRD